MDKENVMTEISEISKTEPIMARLIFLSLVSLQIKRIEADYGTVLHEIKIMDDAVKYFANKNVLQEHNFPDDMIPSEVPKEYIYDLLIRLREYISTEIEYATEDNESIHPYYLEVTNSLVKSMR